MTTDAFNKLIDELESANGNTSQPEQPETNSSTKRDLEGYLRDSGRLLRTIPKPDGIVHEITCINDENHEAAVGENGDGVGGDRELTGWLSHLR